MNGEQALREAALRWELEAAQAQIRDLQQRVFGRKSERSKGANESQSTLSGRPRQHRRGKHGHGRKLHAHSRDTQHFGCDRHRLRTFYQSHRLHLEFQRVLGPFSRLTHCVRPELIFNHQLSSTFLGGKVTLPQVRLSRHFAGRRLGFFDHTGGK